MRPRVVAIVPAAGSGKRLGLKVKKPFVLLGGKPLISHTLGALESSGLIDAIIVAAERSNAGRFRKLVKRYKLKKIIDIVIGGKTRHESVRNCLERVDSSFDMVLIHDGGRPFVSKDEIKKTIALAERYGGSITAVPLTDTIKLAGEDLFVKTTLDRSRIFAAQTPQVFRYKLIKKAYSLKGKAKVTDDASLVENMGGAVKIAVGSYRNIKITTKEDLKFAEALL